MLAKKIKYEDFDGNQREETFYFNLTKSEIQQAEFSVDGGLSTKLKRITESMRSSDMVDIFKDFIQLSYGVKSDDGKFFRKSKEAFEDFKSTNAYDALWMELVEDTNAAIDFIVGVCPAEFQQAAKAAISEELNK